MATTTGSAKKFDCVVLGSGQGGTPLATALAKSGRKTALIERSHIGGCCINEGCTPTKTMIASGRVAYLAGRSIDYGVSQKASRATYALLRGGSKNDVMAPASEEIKPVVNMVRVRQRKRDIVESFRSGSEARLQKVENLEVIRGEAAFNGPRSLSVTIEGADRVEVEAETTFIDTGERPSIPHLDGLDKVLEGDMKERILDSTSIQELEVVPERLIVIGGGYIGMEFGQLFHRLGSQVIILQRGKQVLPREDPEIAEAVRSMFENDGIAVLCNAQPNSIQADGSRLILSCTAGERTADVPASHVLLATGRTPNTDKLGLDKAGVEVDARGHIKVNSRLQTNIQHIYALGDCHGGPAFTHVSYDDYRIVNSNFIEKAQSESSAAERIVPYVVYIDPQLGHVGLHEHEAKKRYPDKQIKTATMPMSYVARALETDETRGLMKAVVDAETEQILGFTCLGMEGGEIMSIVQVAIMGKLPYSKLQQAVFAHPTLAESLNNLWGFLK